MKDADHKLRKCGDPIRTLDEAMAVVASGTIDNPDYVKEIIGLLVAEVERLRTLNPTPISKNVLLDGAMGRHGRREFLGSLFLSAFAKAFPFGKEKGTDAEKLIAAEEISLVLVANGIPMDAAAVCLEWDHQVDRMVEDKAKEMVDGKMGELMEVLENFKKSLKRHTSEKMKKAGIRFEEDDE